MNSNRLVLFRQQPTALTAYQMFGNRNLEAQIQEQEKRKSEEKRALQSQQRQRGVGLSSVGAMDSFIYGGGGGRPSTSSEITFSTFTKQEKKTKSQQQEEDSSSVESFRKAQHARYGAPQQFLEETAEMMARQQGEEDVFDQFRRKNVAEKESDYHARWRKRATLSPDREDPFATSKSQRRTTSSKTTASAAAAPQPVAAQQQQSQQSYAEIMKEVQIEREMRETALKIQRKEEERKRLEGLSKKRSPQDLVQEEAENSSSRSRQSAVQPDTSAPPAKRPRFGGGGGRGDDNRKYEWGNPEQIRQEEEECERKERLKAAGPAEKPSLGLSGALAADTNTVAGTGVVLKWSPPVEARMPTKKWRLYVLRNGEITGEPIPLHESTFRLFGRDRLVVHVPTDHPSCSKQHAVLCFRQIREENEFGETKTVVKPYLIDLQSTNGSFLNGRRIDDSRYYELREFDLLRFGESSREYILMHEDSHFSDFQKKK